METNQQQSSAHKVLGIIGLVLASIGILISLIPCLGFYGIFPAAIGLILGIVSLVLGGKVNAPKGIALTAVVLAVLACGIAIFQYKKAEKFVKDIEKNPSKLKEWVDSTKKKLEEEAKKDSLNQH